MRSLIQSLTIAVLVFTLSCEDIDDPTAGLETRNLFVQYAANTVDTVNIEEGGDAYTWSVQAIISGGQDLVGTVSFSGDAVFSTDFEIAVEDDFENDGLLTSSNEGITFTIPFTPGRGEALIPDQTNLTLSFPEDAIADGNKQLLVTLEGAVGSEDSSIVFDGGRGPIRKVLVVNIADVD